MYILENAVRNVARNRGRNLLLGAVIFTVIATFVIALMINNTTKGIIDNYKSRFGAEVKLEPNMQRMRDEAMKNSTDGRVMMTIPSILPEQYVAFGNSEYLLYSNYTATTGVNCAAVNAVDNELGGGSGMMMMGGPGMADDDAPMQFVFSLWGNKLAEFEDGLRQVAEGRLPESLNECIISTELAALNGLKPGDTLSLYGELRNVEEGAQAGTSYELTVVGTYDDITDEYTEGYMQNAFTNRRNEILTTFETVIQELQPDMSGIRIDATYYLKNPDLLAAFAGEVYAKGLSNIFDVKTDEVSYNKIVGPVEGLKGIAVTFMVVVLVFGGIIIALLSSMAIRERKYEIGVLRAMGMKKSGVALGLWCEMLLVTCACLVIGLGAGRLAAQPITNALLSSQIAAAEAAEEAQSGTGGMMMLGGPFQTSSDAEPLSDIDISLGADTALEIIALALLLATLAGMAAIVRITKYEPIKILMERN